MTTTMLQKDLPCPHVHSCGSSDACAVYENESEMYHCFSCGKNGPVTEQVRTFFEDHGHDMDVRPTGAPAKGLAQPGSYLALDNATHPWGFRGIKRSTCERYNVTVNMGPQGAGLIFPYNDYDTGRIIAQKERNLTSPRGVWHKATEDAPQRIGFFGQHIFNAPTPAKKKLAITFGELDALAVFDMLEHPCVSVPNGDASAPNFFANQFNYLNQWDELILIPDNDEACLKVVPKLTQMFPRKMKVVRLTKEKRKDPNDYLKYGDLQEFRDCFFAAKPPQVEKLKSMGEIMRKHLMAEPPTPLASYPFAELNNKLGGIYPSDIIVIKAPPGVGKTTFTCTMAHHIIKSTTDTDRPLKVGLIMLEETMKDLAFRFATLELGKNMQDPEVQKSVDKEDLRDVMINYDSDDRISVVDHGDTCSTEFLEQKFKELVFARGCDVLLFDHISMAIADDSNDDERKALDKALYAMRSLLTKGLVETLPTGEKVTFHPALILVTHTNKQGDPRGSMAAKQVGNVMLSLKRNPDTLDDIERNMMLVWVEKNRRLGRTGIGSLLYYDNDKGLLEDRTDMIDEEKLKDFK